MKYLTRELKLQFRKYMLGLQNKRWFCFPERLNLYSDEIKMKTKYS